MKILGYSRKKIDICSRNYNYYLIKTILSLMKRRYSYSLRQLLPVIGGLMLTFQAGFLAAPADAAPAEVTEVQSKGITVTGQVLDDTGLSVIGASVVLKGNPSKGTVTDIDGNFTLPGVPSDGTLVISSIGMKPIEVAIKGRTSIKVTLHPDTQLLDEVVVTGYGGKQQRTKLTNSIAKVDDKQLTVGVYSNPAQALAGSVPGLKVTTNSGNPGSVPTIVLRGGTNLDGSGSPLVIIDGQIRDGLNDINPEDIKSMEILKDAGATALYGARASNGVILVTTKSGTYGTKSINLKAKVGLNFINNPYDFLGARDYITAIRHAYNDTPWAPKGDLAKDKPFGTGNAYGPNMIWNILVKTPENAGLLEKGWQEMPDPLDPSTTLIYKETIPMDYNIVNPTLTQDYNINMSGGNDEGSYYAGLGWNHSQGIPIMSYYDRLSFLFNGSYKVTSFLKSTSKFTYNKAKWLSMPPTQENESNYFGRIMSLPPTVRYVDEEGNPVIGPSSSDGNQSFQPEKFKRDNQTDKFTMVQELDFTFAEWLSMRLTGNIYYSEGFYESFNRDFRRNNRDWDRTRNTSASYDRTVSQTYNGVLDFHKVFAGKHNVNVLLGSEFYDRYSRGFGASGSGAPTDDFQALDYTSKKEGKREIKSYHERLRILSYFGRANYDYEGRYLLSLVSRYDGYSSLLGDNRWGFFPGVSAGWVFSEEDFMQSVDWLSFGKLRASFGVNGNASGIGPYELQGTYNSAKYGGSTGFLIGALPNPTLRWERTRTFEMGLDFGLLRNKISGAFTFYDRLTSDKYAQLSLPSTTGFSSVRSNNGELRNRGIELELRANILDQGDFRWDVAANLAYNKNTVVSLPDNGLERNRQGGQQIYTGNKVKDKDGNMVDEKIFVGGYQEGQEPGVLVGYVCDGIFQSDSEIPDDYYVTSGNWQGKWQYSPAKWASLTDQERAKSLLIREGDMKWKDINGDGHIDQFDQVVLGNTIPHWTGGANTTLSYKGLSLYARIDYALGFVRFDQTTSWFLGCMQGTYNTIRETLTDSWTPTNKGAKYPRYDWADQLGKANYHRTSDLFVYKGDYVSLRELSLSYRLPESWCRAILAKSVDLSITGQNLGFLTRGKTANPERAWSGSGYALPRTLLFGVGVSF